MFKTIAMTAVTATALLVSAGAHASCAEAARWKAQQKVSSGAGQTQVIEKVAGKKYIVTTNLNTRLKKTFLVRFYNNSCHPNDARIWQVQSL